MREDHQAPPPLRSPPSTFPAHPASAAAVRRMVEGALGPQVPADVLADAVLVASELASNVILHARTDLTFRVAWDGQTVILEAADRVPGALPAVAAPPPHQPSGRGLWMIDQLASRWGCTPHPAGKRVWVELRQDVWGEL